MTTEIIGLMLRIETASVVTLSFFITTIGLGDVQPTEDDPRTILYVLLVFGIAFVASLVFIPIP